MKLKKALILCLDLQQACMHMWHSSSLKVLFTVLELILNGAQVLPYPFSSIWNQDPSATMHIAEAFIAHASDISH